MKRSGAMQTLWATALCLSAGQLAAAEHMRGTVFADANGNGIQDAREKGIQEVVVSNGRDIVLTDTQGGYVIPIEAGQVVFAVKPARFNARKRANGMPAFWQTYQPSHTSSLKYGGFAPQSSLQFNIGFVPTNARASAPSRVLVFADPQTKNAADVGYYKKDVVADVQQFQTKHKPNFLFGMSLGDIVNDDLSLYPAMNAITATMGVPWLHIPGNHDIDMDASSDAHALDTFRTTYGSDTFAWNEQNFTFIGLDDVIWEGAPSSRYIGGFREDQLAFLRAYLATLPDDRMLVLGMHMPLFEAEGRDTFRDADRQALFDLLARFKHVLVLSAHNHTQQHVFHDLASGWKGAVPLHEYNVGAVCGAFWSGVKDAQGIPVTTMADGTPNGWAMLEIKQDGSYALDWHAARDAKDPAMHLSGPRVLRKRAYPAWGLYVNAYMIAPDAKVEFKVDDGAWKSMQRVRRADPDLLAENVRDDAATTLRGYDRSPEAQTVEHLWRGALPTQLPVGIHTVKVRYLDINGRAQTAQRTYTLQEATP